MNAIRTSARFLLTSSFGLAMTALVFFGLRALTERAGDATLEVVEARKVNFTRLVVDRERVDNPRVKPKPPDGQKQPPPPDGPRVCSGCNDPRKGAGPVHAVVTNPRPRGPLVTTPATDGDPQPFVRVLPEYPPNGRGDGWVLVQFDLSAAGTVVDASPRGMFEKSALKAIERWRYRPAVVDGQAVTRRGLRVRLSFVLEKV